MYLRNNSDDDDQEEEGNGEHNNNKRREETTTKMFESGVQDDFQHTPTGVVKKIIVQS